MGSLALETLSESQGLVVGSALVLEAVVVPSRGQKMDHKMEQRMEQLKQCWKEQG